MLCYYKYNIKTKKKELKKLKEINHRKKKNKFFFLSNNYNSSFFLQPLSVCV